VAVNLFRPLAPGDWETSDGAEAAPVYDPEDDEPVLDDAWPHLRLVYKLLLTCLESPALKPALAARALSHAWVRQLLGLFASGDPRERTYLKTALHRLYGRFVDLRLFVRQRLALLFTDFAHDGDRRHPGIAELLEVLGTYVLHDTRDTTRHDQ
jgi:serine/threonine-protein phosphatase 2A regulatory subunit B'